MNYFRIKSVVNFLSILLISFPVVAANLEDVRGLRYCEIIFSQSKLKFAVYSTIKLNDCPEALWKTISASEVKKEIGSYFVYLNGPRYFVIDGMKDSKLVSPTKRSFGGLDMREAGIVHLSLWDLVMGARPYREHRVDRETTWVYKAGRPVYELIDPKGQVFVMQSYSLEKEPLTASSLAGLGAKLTVPTGWTYKVGVLKKNVYLKAVDKVAIVIQDNLLNTYQLAQNDFLNVH